MPGMIGIVAGIGQPQINREIARMAQLMRRKPSMLVDNLSSAEAGLGSVSLSSAPQPLAAAGSSWLAVAGHIVETQNLVRGLPGDQQGQPLARLLLERYLAQGPQGLMSLNGSYAAVVWDAVERRLTIVKDRLGGASNVYYWLSPGRLMFASEIKAISWHPDFHRQIDEVAAADVILNLWVYGNRTLFRDIHWLPSAGYLTYQDGKLETSIYWKPTFYIPGSRQRSEDEYIDEMAHHLYNAVARRVRPNQELMITGGYDSRTVAGFYQRAAPGVPLVTATIGKKSGLDFRIGRTLAERLGYSHYHIPLDSTYLVKYAARCAWRGEGKQSAFASWIYAGEDFLESRGLDNSITGVFGNFVSGRHLPPGMAEAKTLDEGRLALEMYYHKRMPYLCQLMRLDVRARAQEASANFPLQVFQSTEAPDLLNRFDMVLLATQVTRISQNNDVLGDVSTVMDPFTDLDLMEFALSMPPRVRAKHNFYLKMITRHLPEVTGVPNNRSGMPTQMEMFVVSQPVLRQIEYYRRMALKRFLPQWFSLEAQGCIPYAEAIRTGSRDFVERELSKNEYLDDVFDMNAVRQMLADHLLGKEDYHMPLTGLMMISLFRQQLAERYGPVEEEPAAINLPQPLDAITG